MIRQRYVLKNSETKERNLTMKPHKSRRAGMALVLAGLAFASLPVPSVPAVGTATNLPASVDLRLAFKKWDLPIGSQGGRGHCSVFTMTGAMEYALASQH